MPAVACDTEKLVNLYAIVSVYINHADEHIAVIEQQINILNDPEVKDGLSGGRGEYALNAIQHFKTTIDSFKSQLCAVRGILDDRIAVAKQMSANDGGFEDLGRRVQAKAAELKALKK